MMNHLEALTVYTASIVDELARVGITNVVVSPGSRSTPMALLLSEHPNIDVHIHVDERSAAFYALGMAKAAKEPVAILCTSGTAAANYMPAVVEAYYSRVPLIVMTADRPHELRDVGAPQAIDQLHLFGKHVKWFVEMALPESNQQMKQYARTVCARAKATAMQAPAGPVHMNIPFREPLIPDLEHEQLFKSDTLPVHVYAGALTLNAAQFREISTEFASKEKGLIICGALEYEDASEQIVKLAEKLGFPILADPLSQLRSQTAGINDVIIDTYDTFLRNEDIAKTFKPEIIIRFGAMPISKALFLYLKEHKSVPQFVIDNGAGWRDPGATATNMIYCDEAIFAKKVCEQLAKKPSQSIWMEKWVKLNELTKNSLKKMEASDYLNEGTLIYQLTEILPEHSGLFVGNSMPIRDLDSFFHVNDKKIKIYANRGANGIDGIVSTALGVANTHQPMFLLLGDLTFYHDLNGLLATKLHNVNITIILVNNNGGGIFSFLPQSKHPKHFEVLFGTPLDLSFEHAVKMYGGQFTSISNWSEFTEAMKKAILHEGLDVIEVPTIRQENADIHRELWENVSQEISTWILGECR